MSNTANRIADVLDRFGMSGLVVDCAAFRGGHIHASYSVTVSARDGGDDATSRGATRYLLQRINQRVFGNVSEMMENITRVSRHLRGALAGMSREDIDRRVLTLVESPSGQTCVRDADGKHWRMYRFIENSRVFETARTPVQAEAAASAFGAFQRMLADLPGPRLHETIPDFHNTPLRCESLERAIEADGCGRAASVAAEIEFARERRAWTGRLIDLQQGGAIPERIVHNDAKISNVLFDENTGEALCVVDLDTVMPGLSLYDFGDMVRSMACPAAEDEADLSRVAVSADLFAAIARGYLSTAGAMLTPTEREHLVVAGKLITFEQGVRFLADFLDGDRYYPVKRERHNLERARNQFALLRSIEAREDELREIVARTWQDPSLHTG